jgi:transposase
MLMLPPTVKIYVAARPVDARLSFDGLAQVARQYVHQDPLSGHLFVFFNRRKDRVKILFWDRTGFCLFYKRLEQGPSTYRPLLPKRRQSNSQRPNWHSCWGAST